MIADFGTRRGCLLADISQDSTWFNGLPWMRELFPVAGIDDIKLNQKDIKFVNKEQIVTHIDPKFQIVEYTNETSSAHLSSITKTPVFKVHH